MSYVRFALTSSGEPADAYTAPRCTYYICGDCGGRVIVRRGYIKEPHFAHIASGSNCTGESALHLAAKHHVASLLKSGDLTPLIVKYDCPGYITRSGYPQTCSNNTVLLREIEHEAWDGVGIEVRYGNHVLDVALTSKGTSKLGLEVYNTHRVDTEKRRALSTSELPWGEFSAREVLHSPPPWRALASSLNYTQCRACSLERVPEGTCLDEVKLDALSNLATWGAEHRINLAKRHGKVTVDKLERKGYLRQIPVEHLRSLMVLGPEGRCAAGLSRNYVPAPDSALTQHDRRRAKAYLVQNGWRLLYFARPNYDGDPVPCFGADGRRLFLLCKANDYSLGSLREMIKKLGTWSDEQFLLATRRPAHYQSWCRRSPYANRLTLLPIS